MFKKLKQKISEEQTSGRGSPGCGASGFSQRSSETSALSPSIHRNRTSLTEQNDDNTSTPNRELLAGMISEPAFLSEYTVFALEPTKRPKSKSECVIIHKQNTSNESETSSVELIDQKMKRHLQEEFAASLEEKDQIIRVLQTQVSLLKQQLHSNEINIELPIPNVQTQSQVQSPVKNQNMENTLQSAGPVGNENADKTIETLTQRIKHQENLLHQCKERIKSQKERLAQLTSEKEALQEQLYERLQELEKIKDCHMVEKNKIITQLHESKNVIEQLEQDKGMIIAETKRQMHETLELKEEEIAQLYIHIKQVVLQSEELKKQKEKTEKTAFEQLEKTLSAAQLAEEAHRKVQAEMDEKMKAVEKANEEECVILQQELTRVKEEVRILELENSPTKCPQTAKLLKEKEAIFHAHIEEMNEKTLEKLDLKQTELEALSSELSDALNTCQNLEQYISKLKEDADKAKVQFETKLNQQRNNHKEQVEAILKDQEVIEKSFKEEIIQLKQLLEAKEKSEEELEQKKMKETLGKAESQCKRMSAELDFLCQSREDNPSIYENKFKNLQEKLEVIKHKKSKLELVVKTETQLNEVKTELDFQTSQVNDLKCELEEEKRENIQNTSSLTEKYESQLRNLEEEISQLKSHCTGKESKIGQIKHFMKQQIEKYRQLLSTKEEEISALRDKYELKLKQQETQAEEAIEKVKKMQEEFKQKLSEQEAKLKKEIEGNQLEFCQKEKQFTSKMLAMAHASSLGINDAISKLEMNQKKQLKSMAEAHKQEVGEVLHLWEKKLKQQAEELWGKHEIRLQEKEQEIRDLKERLATFDAEREGNNAEITWLKNKDAKKDKTIHELQEQLQQTLAQVNLLKQKEIDLKKQLVKLENDLNFSLKEKITVQEQLNELMITEEKKEYDLLELADKLKMSDVELHALKMSHLKEQENYGTKLEGERNEFQQKQAEFENFKRDTIRQLADYQQKAKTLLKIKVGELIEQCNENISSIIVKIAHCQQQTIKIKEGILIKINQIPDLEFQLKQLTESHVTLNSSLQESKKHLEEKEHLILSMKADMEKLLTEKELLQKESYFQQQTATEKESCITELKKELSVHNNVVTSMREEINEKKAEITDLNKLISELNLRLENTILEKETATTMLNKQHKENELQLLNEMEVLSSKVESLSEDKVIALKQVDHWMNKMSEWKKKAQLRFTQNYNTIKELQNKIELINNQVSEKEEELNRRKEEHDKQTKQLEHLKSLMEQKQVRKEKQESDLVGEIKIRSARIAELEEHIARKTMENDYLMEECKKYHEQDSEQNEMAQQLQQAQGAIVDKDDKLKEMEQKVLTFEKKMQVMEIDLEEKSKEFEGIKLALLKTKEEELKALEERLISETTSKIADLKKKAEHKIASIKRQLSTQMEEKEQQNKLEKKLQEKEKIMSLDLEKELIQKVETIKVSAEQDKVHALENMQKMYDLKIDVLRKDLLDKERLLEKYNEETKMCNISKMETQDQQELLKRAQEDKNKIENLQRELEEQIKKQASLLKQHTKYESELTNIKVELKNKEVNQQNMEIALKDLEKKLQEKEQEEQSLQQKIYHFGEDFMKERQHKIEVKNRITEYDEKLNRLQEQVDERSGLIKILEGNIEEKTKLVFELQKMVDKMQMQQKDLQTTLKHTEQEKQEYHRNMIKLQKDLRTLRKDYQQELEIMKKESREEMEQKIKYEQEDIELKHNSTLKQLMREFNTQLAQKDQELEMAVKETISKAQEVESELIESHQTETVQLHKKISEKDDDLQRTVKKYEEILEAREEEMTKKVNKLEEQLVQLHEDYNKRLAHEESWNGDEEKIAELQTQLAQKTTLVNDSKLKEQEFREQIHTLQDKLKNYEKAVYVTTVKTPYRDGNLCHSDVSVFGEPTEFEYLRKVIFEYMMGRETKTMAKVITSVLKFPPDQTQKILEQENARTLLWF